jgi:hypothetical protein
MIAQSEMVYNAQAMAQLEKIRRNRAELREMLAKLDNDVRALEEKKGLVPPSPFAPAPIPVSSPVHPVPSVYAVRRQVPAYPMYGDKQAFDMSKVDPIFREAAKDKALRIQFMDCTDLAMQCALVKHKA